MPAASSSSWGEPGVWPRSCGANCWDGALTCRRRKAQMEAGVKKQKKKTGKLGPALTQKRLRGFLGIKALDPFVVPQTGLGPGTRPPLFLRPRCAGEPAQLQGHLRGDEVPSKRITTNTVVKSSRTADRSRSPDEVIVLFALGWPRPSRSPPAVQAAPRGAAPLGAVLPYARPHRQQQAPSASQRSGSRGARGGELPPLSHISPPFSGGREPVLTSAAVLCFISFLSQTK